MFANLGYALVLVSFFSFGFDNVFAKGTSTTQPSLELVKHPTVRGDEITPAQQAAVQKGLDWLARQQESDGGYKAASYGAGPHSGITAIAGLAFMEAGMLPGRGRYGLNVQKAMEFQLKNAQEDGLILNAGASNPMYSHGFSTLFLAELYGMTGDESLKEILIKAVRLIERTQNSEGGWRYQPVPFDADISVTIAEVMALRAAHDAGITVDREVIENALQYIHACQSPDGGFAYQAHMMGGSDYTRTAAGVAALYYLGEFNGDALTRGLQYLKESDRNDSGFYFYRNYYAVQAMFLAGGDYWKQYYPMIRDELIQRQDKEGDWTGEAGEAYATAMALLILQMPNRLLPVYNGKGPGD